MRHLLAHHHLNHNTRNRLNAAALGLHLLHRKLEAGDLSDAEATIFNIFKELKGIEALLDGPAKSEREANVRRSSSRLSGRRR